MLGWNTSRAPAGVRAEEAKASFDNGVLQVKMPKSEEAYGKKIPIHQVCVRDLGRAMAAAHAAADAYGVADGGSGMSDATTEGGRLAEGGLVRALLDVVPVGIVIGDRNCVVLWSNQAAERMLGGQLTGKRFAAQGGVALFRLDGSPLPVEEVPLFSAAETGASAVGHEVLARYPNGAEALLLMAAGPVQRTAGEVAASVMVIQDITEARREEQAMWRLAAIVASSIDAMIATDANGRVTAWNRGAENLYGLAADKVMGRPITELFMEDGRGNVPDVVARAMAGEAQAPFEMSHRLADGTVVDVSVTASPILGPGGEVAGVSWIGRDITARKRDEVALRDAQRRLEAALARERRIASRFQGAVLPQGAAAIPGYEVAYAYHPALQEADIGGDFYNVFNLDGGCVGLVVGDIGGKGLDAAVIAARVQHSLMALAMAPCGKAEERPGRVLEVIGRVMIATDPDRLVTVFLGILTPASGALRYASAGHETVLLWKARSRSVERLAATGPAVVGLPVGSYVTSEAVLDEGDMLFAYTDGLREARPGKGGEPWGEERILALFTQLQHEDPGEVVREMHKGVLDYSGGSVSDDIALLAVRRQ